jgi:cytidylate kinase
MSLIIAIDGPSASGKSTVSRRVAERLGFIHVDSGSLYRGLSWYFLKERIAADDKEKMVAELKNINMFFFTADNSITFSINGIKPEAELRAPAVDENVSLVAAIPEVREWIVCQLRKMPSFGNLVVEGRDIGTAVFPEAQFKFYLDATPEERARRRFRELSSAGQRVEYDDILRSILKRDGIDSTRAVAPLKIAPGAVVIQTTKMTIAEVVDLIITRVQGSKFSVHS